MTLFTGLFLQALYIGSEWAIVAVAFGLVARTCRVYHLALGGLFSLGAYTIFFVIAQHHGGVVIAIVAASVLAGLAGALIDRLVYQPVTGLYGQRNVSHLAPFVASLGVMIVIRNGLQLGFGASPLFMHAPRLGITVVNGASVETWRLLRAALSLLAILAFGGWLRFSRAGVSTRALGQNTEGASVVGISETLVRLQLFFLTGALTGFGGALALLSHSIKPEDGFPVLLYGSLIALILPEAGVIAWWLAAVAAALVYGLGVVWFGQGWEDTLLQGVLLGALVVTRTVVPHLRHTLRRRAERTTPLAPLAEGSPGV